MYEVQKGREGSSCYLSLSTGIRTKPIFSSISSRSCLTTSLFLHTSSISCIDVLRVVSVPEGVTNKVSQSLYTEALDTHHFMSSAGRPLVRGFAHQQR